MNWSKYWTFFLAIWVVIVAVGNCQDRPLEFVASWGMAVSFVWILVTMWVTLWVWDTTQNRGVINKFEEKNTRHWGSE